MSVWTPARDAELRRLWRENATVEKIATKLGAGLTVQAVRRRARYLQITRPRGGPTPEQRERLAYLWRLGVSGPGIAKDLGTLPQTTYHWIKQAIEAGALPSHDEVSGFRVPVIDFDRFCELAADPWQPWPFEALAKEFGMSDRAAAHLAERLAPEINAARARLAMRPPPKTIEAVIEVCRLDGDMIEPVPARRGYGAPRFRVNERIASAIELVRRANVIRRRGGFAPFNEADFYDLERAAR